MQNGVSLAYLSLPAGLSVSPSQIFSAQKIPPFVREEREGEAGGRWRGEGEEEGERTVSLILCLEYE